MIYDNAFSISEGRNCSGWGEYVYDTQQNSESHATCIKA